MFGSYRAAHEINRDRVRAVGARVLTGELDADSARVRAELRRRSMRYHLEVDVAGHMAVFAGPLARMYSDARFVLLIRDCFSWLDSVVDQQLRSLSEGRVRDAYYQAKYLRYDDTFDRAEAPLRDAGLIPIASWFRGWAEANQRVLGAVPPDRLLVVRTEDLDDSVAMLAQFAGVPESTIRLVHANRNPSPTGLLGAVPASYVVEQARRHCGPIMERAWGANWTDLCNRIPPHPPT
jgi:Sulfotransferase domain